ncbi:Uncharacterised protein [Edwardsiella hoshinae]|uniref:Uncharacterized protein n=1 Tax=Edwardsiella hoshinae TaxID=93378 RepID=A0A376DG78_9GAMM|nr:Uncharacterised protein [Edwardsiella hoshinae]
MYKGASYYLPVKVASDLAVIQRNAMASPQSADCRNVALGAAIRRRAGLAWQEGTQG